MKTQRRVFVEWVLMCLLLPMAVFALERQFQLLPRLDLMLYDRWLPARKPGPASDILIIGIDHKSLHDLGPWPWSRAVHKQLLDRIALAAPRRVMFDFFLEASDAADDALRDRMKQIPVYLPLRRGAVWGCTVRGGRSFVGATPRIAEVAQGSGHAHAPSDVDDVVRKLYRYEGPSGDLRPYIGSLIAESPPLTAPSPSASAGPKDWLMESGFGLAIAGPPGTYPTVSYASVMRGEVSPDLLRGRDLLVGFTIDGGRQDAPMVMIDGHPRMLSHVELQANAIDALRQGRTIPLPAIWMQAAWVALPIWLVMVLFLRRPRYALAVTLLVCAGCAALSAVLLTREVIWLPPTASLAGISVAYLLWSWRRLDAMYSFFGKRVAQLNAIPAGAFELAPRTNTSPMNATDQQTAALDHAILRLTHLQSLLSKGLWQLPLAVLVCRADGTIGQSNAAACKLLLRGTRSTDKVSTDALAGANLLAMLSHMARDKRPDAVPTAAAVPSWPDLDGREFMTAHGKEFRVQVAAIDEAQSSWAVVLRDMSAQYQAERERARWLGFLSHDLRSPQVSILSQLSLYTDNVQGMDETRLVEGVRREAERTLALAEGLIDVTEAMSDDYRFEPLELGSVVLDAIERAAPYAALRQVALSARTPDTRDCPVFADGSLLQRALLNILNNAIRHSTTGGAVRICFEASTDEKPMAVIAICDEGEGMSADSLAQLLSPARPQRSGDEILDMEPVQRRGLGLSLVHAVVERHDGWIDAHSMPRAGTTLLIGLPLHN